MDALSSIGDPATLCEYMDSILEGLPQEYDIVIALIESCLKDITVEEAEGLILVHELRLQKYRKKLLWTLHSLPLLILLRTTIRILFLLMKRMILNKLRTLTSYSDFHNSGGHGSGGCFGCGCGR